MKILQLNTSARSVGANSTRLADAITARLKAKQPGAEVMLRDFARTPHPQLDESALTALFTPPAQRTPAQSARVALDDELIAEVKSADILVLGVPMYNLNVPVQLKAWIDAIARAGETFRYTENGPQGLLTGKKVYLGLARGGKYRGTAADHQAPYLKVVFEFVGISDIEFIYAEGLAMGEEAAKNGFSAAEARMNELFA
jgi:FMN-dependent NADH-azoreductase